MFRCLECKTEYKEIPEYCDCGNNTFEEIPLSGYAQNSDSVEPVGRTPIDKGQLISIIIFIFCMIFSACVWLFMWNVKANDIPAKTKSEFTKKAPKNIPDINKIWDDTPVSAPAVKIEEPAPVETSIMEKVRQIIQDPPYMRQIKEPKAQVVMPKNDTSKPVNSGVANNTSSKNTGVKLPSSVVNVDVPVPKQVEVPKVVEPTKPVSNLNSAEFIKYKNALRSALFTKLAVGSIQGSGTCSIQFTINKNGKLENRTFTQKSDNKALNDAVYYMMMSVPQYYPPPDSYNGETLRLEFLINNGYYEISYK